MLRIIGTARLVRTTCLASILLSFSSFADLSSIAVAQCRPGDVLIGEDEHRYYCSTRSCDEIAVQLTRDQEAIRRLQASILAGNRELDEWSTRNAKAADKALKDATNFFGSSVVGALKSMGSSQLEEVEKEFKRRIHLGLTWRMHIERVQDLRSRSARLHGAIDGLKLATLPGVDPEKWWTAVKAWATSSEADASGITQALTDIRKDPEAEQILLEQKVSFAADVMSLALGPIVKQAVSSVRFVANYGYDATEWLASKARIEQNVLNQEQNRIAICKLNVQLQKTVRDANICKKNYPDKSEILPDPNKCR